MLSHDSIQPPRDLIPPQTASLDQAPQQTDIPHHPRSKQRDDFPLAPRLFGRPVARFSTWLSSWRRVRLTWTLLPLGVEKLLLSLSRSSLVVSRAARARARFAVSLSAAKRTAKIPATRVARMGEEKNPAMPATSTEALQGRLLLQHGPQDGIMIQDQVSQRALSVPVSPKLEMLLDSQYKNASVSLMMWRFVCMSPSYILAAPRSNSRTGIFSRLSPPARCEKTPRRRAGSPLDPLADPSSRLPLLARKRFSSRSDRTLRAR